MEGNKREQEIEWFPMNYYLPESINEATFLMDTYGNDAVIISGGVQVTNELSKLSINPSAIIDLNKVSILKEIQELEDYICIGACVKHVEVSKSPVIHKSIVALSNAAEKLGDLQIRNMASVGGTIALSDSYGDYWSILLAAGGYVNLSSKKRERKVQLSSWLEDRFLNIKEQNEIITSIHVCKVEKSIFLKQDFPNLQSLCIAGVIKENKGRIVITGATHLPIVFSFNILNNHRYHDYFNDFHKYLVELYSHTLDEYLFHMTSILVKKAINHLNILKYRLQREIE